MSILVAGRFGLLGSMLTRISVKKGERVWVFNKSSKPPRFSGIENSGRTIPADLGIFSMVGNFYAELKGYPERYR